MAVDVFRRIGDLCLQAKAKLALEPNAAAYGTNFLNTIGETLAFVQRVRHPAVSVNFDIGSLHMNGEMARGWRVVCQGRAARFARPCERAQSRPGAAGRGSFEALAREILAHGYGGWFSIEMRAVGDDNLAGVRDAVAACSRALAAAAQRKGLNR